MSQQDPYVYPGTDVLQNKFGIPDQAALTDREIVVTAEAMDHLRERPVKGNFDFDHYCEIHRRIFDDVYDFAGKPRSIELWKSEIALNGGSANYAAPHEIKSNAEAALKSLNSTKWTDLTDRAQSNKFAQDVAKLWLAHPFREGNTRTILSFMRQFTHEKGLDLDFSVLSRMPSDTRDAFLLAAHGMTANLAPLIREARQAFIDRNHPVLGRISSQANEVLNLMGEMLNLKGKPPVEVAKVGEQVSGKVLATSYQTVLVTDGRRIRAVDLANFGDVPANDKRVNIEVKSVRLDRSAGEAIAEKPNIAPSGSRAPTLSDFDAVSRRFEVSSDSAGSKRNEPSRGAGGYGL